MYQEQTKLKFRLHYLTGLGSTLVMDDTVVKVRMLSSACCCIFYNHWAADWVKNSLSPTDFSAWSFFDTVTKMDIFDRKNVFPLYVYLYVIHITQ